MEAEQSKTWLCPAVKLFEVGTDGVVGEPEVLFVREAIRTLGRTNTPDLLIVCGPLSSPSARAQAVQISGRQAEPVLLVAVLQLQEDMPSPAAAQLQELYGAFDAVFVINGAAREQLVRRLVRAITTPGGPDQWIGCDWNDVCYIASGSADARPARYGFGRGVGEGRAIEATVAAVEQISRQGASLRDARGVCVAINAAPTVLHGREIKEVMGQIRAGIHPAANVVQCIGYDSTLDVGTMEVDIFAFGECDATPLALASASHLESFASAGNGAAPALDGQAPAADPKQKAKALESAGLARQKDEVPGADEQGKQPLDIPEFLRRG
jgi:hypothetical protein